jgi:predicted aspartyl protease
MNMGKFNVEVTLRNPGDVAKARDGFIKKEDIREETVTAVVDTGASTMVITEELREKLGLEVERRLFAGVANGSKTPGKRTEAVEVQWENRTAVCNAVVLEGGDRCLLGAIPLEGMVLKVNPLEMRLERIYPDDFFGYIDGLTSSGC